jgi:hypothetical protein
MSIPLGRFQIFSKSGDLSTLHAAPPPLPPPHPLPLTSSTYPCNHRRRATAAALQPQMPCKGVLETNKNKFRFEPKQTETRSVSRLFRFVS